MHRKILFLLFFIISNIKEKVFHGSMQIQINIITCPESKRSKLSNIFYQNKNLLQLYLISTFYFLLMLKILKLRGMGKESINKFCILICD